MMICILKQQIYCAWRTKKYHCNLGVLVSLLPEAMLICQSLKRPENREQQQPLRVCGDRTNTIACITCNSLHTNRLYNTWYISHKNRIYTWQSSRVRTMKTRSSLSDDICYSRLSFLTRIRRWRRTKNI